ncbi:LOW QUALITY PROTEIN: olfactory receptor 1P1-like [Corythoichthys intestinalis]|uniref:LOW QUALITY PROTEIN: olfactory receptor 1P1-like n=1 Tax=Corythoichthys intestinalis TaxID=161448 RepID=UPI0025A57BE9|nr:LOW QUALITY PROTEIN: olfactory receptor 1P1-like [Corythoichthys intestinalis]
MRNRSQILITKYRYVYFVSLLTVYVFIICSNCSIIGLIWNHRNLHEPMYIFIAALCLNSLMFSNNIYPKVFVDIMSHRQSISHSACMLQLFFFYTFGSSDFFLLAAMAYDRYVSICKPLQYATTMNATRVTVLIALSWFLPACLTAAATSINAKQKMCRFVSAGIFCNNSINKLHCVRSKMLAVIALFILFNGVFVPMLFILFTYIRIFIVVYRGSSRDREKAAETCLPHMIVLICFFCLGAFDVITGRVDSELPKSIRLMMILQMVVLSPLFNPIIYGLRMKSIRKYINMLFYRIVI